MLKRCKFIRLYRSRVLLLNKPNIQTFEGLKETIKKCYIVSLTFLVLIQLQNINKKKKSFGKEGGSHTSFIVLERKNSKMRFACSLSPRRI